MEEEQIFKELILSKNDLLDEIYALSCSLSFISTATALIMEKDEVSSGFYNQLSGLNDKLNEIISNYEIKFEEFSDNLNFFIHNQKKEILKLTEKRIKELEEEFKNE